MEILKGIGVSPGVVVCSAVILEAEDYRISQRFVARQQVRPEIHRLRQAFLDLNLQPDVVLAAGVQAGVHLRVTLHLKLRRAGGGRVQ